MQTLLAVGRGILLLASFIGLCAGLRVRFGLDRMIAPFAAVSGIIAALMLFGVAGILKIGLYALYALGFAGLFYAYWLRRARPEYALILALAGYCAFLVWRFYPCPLYLNDDISHWGLVARHLLRHDAFPDASADYVFFQSYPLGAACFIYYVCRAVANAEGLYVAAQNLLLGPLFLPLLAHVRGNRRTCYPAAAALFVFLFHYFRRMVNLEVDLPLAFFGIGLAATAAFYRDDRKRALGAVLPGIVAVIYVKNSGAFFALTTLLLLVYFARRRGKPAGRIWKTALICAGSAAIAYLIWALHLRASFPDAASTKHAVSLSAYIAQFRAKGWSGILKIVKAVLKRLVRPTRTQLLALAFMLGSGALLHLGCRRIPGQAARLPALRRAWWASVGAQLLWLAMVLAMYVFSMPENEAVEAASFARYNSAGLAYMMGLTAIALFSLLGGEGVEYRPLRALRWGALAVIAVYAAGYCFLAGPDAPRSFQRDMQYSDLRAALIQAHEEYSLPDGGRYLVYSDHGAETEPLAYNELYHVKYEFETADILVIAGEGPFAVGNHLGKASVDDARPTIAENIDDCDAFMIIGSSPEFDEQLRDFLEDYGGDTPVIYIDRDT